MAYAIYRHSKHKNLGTVTASSRHMTREATTPNADPARADLNQILIGSEDPAADVAALVPSSMPWTRTARSAAGKTP